VDYHAATESEAYFNYKVLQTGFTAIHLTRVRACVHVPPPWRRLHIGRCVRGCCHAWWQPASAAAAWLQEIHVSKLARGSRSELLELLQYLYKYLLSESARCQMCWAAALYAAQHLLCAVLFITG
jgi:hypothetical protein